MLDEICEVIWLFVIMKELIVFEVVEVGFFELWFWCFISGEFDKLVFLKVVLKEFVCV